MSGVIEHLEQYLGEIDSGWSRDADGRSLPYQVVRFRRALGPGTVAFSTLGLNRVGLKSRMSDKHVHLELMMIVPAALRDGPVPGLLQHVANELLSDGFAILRGDVIGPRGSLFTHSKLEALYCAIPVYFPDEFAVATEGDLKVAIVWLVPISRDEATFVQNRGWNEFEEKLVAVDPNLVDIYRESIV